MQRDELHRVWLLTVITRLGFTSPCKEGLIFVSRDPIDADATRRYNNMTYKKFLVYSKDRVNRYANSIQPIAFFRLKPSRNYSTTQRLKLPVTGRYILIKLLRADWASEETSSFDNIDIQYIGFKVRPECQSLHLQS